MKQFLIIGADSVLAKCFSQIYSNDCVALTRKDCDITSQQQIVKQLSKTECKYVLNCAAITDIELCENDPLQCLTVNTTGVYLLNELCKKYDKKLIHISSDYAIKPTNIYGWSKYLSEQLLDKKFLTVRTNFYHPQTYAVKKLLQHEPINSYTNVFFNPISIYRLVKEIYEHRNSQGIVNIFTNKRITYYDFAKHLSEVFGLDQKLVTPIIFKNQNDRAFRPLTSYVKSDININIIEDLKTFKNLNSTRQISY